MNIRANSRTRRAHERPGANYRIAYVTLMLLCLMIKPGVAAPDDEVRAAFDRFVVAQNAQDIKVVESLLLNSPDFLWITRGAPVWGAEAAIKRFANLYKGTWRLEPEPGSLKVTMLSDGVAQIYVPIMFTIGAPGQSAQQTRFLMNQVLVRTQSGWRVSSILPIAAPAQ